MKKVVYYLLKNRIGSLFLDCLSEREGLSFWFDYGNLLMPTRISDFSGEGVFQRDEDDLKTIVTTEIELESLDEEQSKKIAFDFNEYGKWNSGYNEKTGIKRPESYLVTKIIENSIVYQLYFRGSILHVTTPDRISEYSQRTKWKNKEPGILIKMAIPLNQEQRFKIQKGENNVFRVYNY